jgi:hypothetical protein
MAKLNQIIAIEKGVKSQAYGQLTQIDKANQKPDLFNGMVRAYRPKDDSDDEKLPAESKRVQLRANEVLNRIAQLSTEWWDITARKDWTNCAAVADIKVDDETVLTGVPVTFLLFLEKQLTDVRTMMDRLPVLDSAENWEYDENAGVYKTETASTHRTKKVQKSLVLIQPTPEHPGQAQLITEDVIAGYWDTTKQSGAMPFDRKELLLKRVDALLQAVKQAREAANAIEEKETPKIGDAIFTYLLAPAS